MAKVVRQFRFYTMNSGSTMYTKNYPRDAKVQDYSSGSVFDKIGCFPIVQLGVQALPGTKMYLNGSTESIIIQNRLNCINPIMRLFTRNTVMVSREKN